MRRYEHFTPVSLWIIQIHRSACRIKSKEKGVETKDLTLPQLCE